MPLPSIKSNWISSMPLNQVYKNKKLSWCWQTRPMPCYAVLQNLVKIGWCAAELLHIVNFQNGGHLPSWTFYLSAILGKNSNLRLFLCRAVKFGEDRTMCGRVIAYFRFSKWWSSAILDFHIFAISWKIQIFTYIYVDKQNLMKIGLSAAELLRIFDFQTGRRPPSSIFIFPQFLWKIQISPIY